MSDEEKTNDPQVVVQGRLKQGIKSDVIVFRLIILLVEMVFIVTVPAEGTDTAPVYIKFKLRKE